MTTTAPLPLSDEAIADLKSSSNYPHGFYPPNGELLGLLATTDHWKARAEQAEAALRIINADRRAGYEAQAVARRVLIAVLKDAP